MIRHRDAKKIPAAPAAGEGGMVEEIYILIDTINPVKLPEKENIFLKMEFSAELAAEHPALSGRVEKFTVREPCI